MKRLLALCLLFASCAHAQTAKPVLLVASPAMQGLYSRTTLVALPAGEAHVGFIINRATQVKLATVFPEHAPCAKVIDPIYFGGPEMADAIFAVVRRDPGVEAVPLFDGLFLVVQSEGVDRVIEQTPNEARYFAGFVGWQPGELAKEIDAGYWYVTDADPAILFRRDAGTLWQELIERLGNGHAPQRGRGFQSARLEN